MEGNRAMLIEVQALVSSATYGTPQRSTTGYDVKRLHMLLAVLEKRLGIKVSNQDVFLNIAGGIKVQDTSLDLAVCAAIFSSYHDISISTEFCIIGEVGLSGELRSIGRLENRINEADRLGFLQAVIPDNTGFSDKTFQNIKLLKASFVKDALGQLFS